MLCLEQHLKQQSRGALLCSRLRGGKGTGFVGSPWATENPVTRFPPGQRWWRQPPKGVRISLARRAVVWFSFFPRAKPGCKGFIYTGAFNYFKRRPPKPSAAKPLSNLSPFRTLGPKGRQPSRPQGRVHKRPPPPLTQSPSPIDGGGKGEGRACQIKKHRPQGAVLFISFLFLPA